MAAHDNMRCHFFSDLPVASSLSLLPSPNLIEKSALFHLIEITRIDHLLRFDGLGARVGGGDLIEGRLESLGLIANLGSSDLISTL